MNRFLFFTPVTVSFASKPPGAPTTSSGWAEPSAQQVWGRPPPASSGQRASPARALALTQSVFQKPGHPSAWATRRRRDPRRVPSRGPQRPAARRRAATACGFGGGSARRPPGFPHLGPSRCLPSTHPSSPLSHPAHAYSAWFPASLSPLPRDGPPPTRPLRGPGLPEPTGSPGGQRERPWGAEPGERSQRPEPPANRGPEA